MPEFYATFQEKIQRTRNVTSFRFLPEKKVAFAPGQFVQVLFDEKDRANKVLNKYLSFSCGPANDYVELTKKISSSEFSQRLQGLNVKDRVLFKGPMGNCVLDEKQPKIGFLIGGIGITPVISMVEHIARQKLSNDFLLLYANWTEADIAFKNELDAWAFQQKNVRIVHVLVECPSGETKFLKGLITKDFVLQHMPDYKERLIYAVGPPGMVTAMKEICQQLGCLPERVKAENFIGY